MVYRPEDYRPDLYVRNVVDPSRFYDSRLRFLPMNQKRSWTGSPKGFSGAGGRVRRFWASPRGVPRGRLAPPPRLPLDPTVPPTEIEQRPQSVVCQALSGSSPLSPPSDLSRRSLR